MPGPWCPDDARLVAVAALSGRALAAAAVRAGHRPIVIDGFGDGDTRDLAAACRTVPIDRRGSLAARPLACAAAGLPLGVTVVYGAGFEATPERLSVLVARGVLAGNAPAVVAAVKAPERFFPTLAPLGVAYPETRRAPPHEPEGWLVKRVGGSGGAHVRSATAADRGREDRYFQRRVEGRTLSAQVLADGTRAQIVAFTESWCDPAPGRPWRFGGLAGPVRPPQRAAAAMRAAVQAIVPALGLVGLCSVDFVVAPDGVWLLEVNPRPGASLDVLAGIGDLFDRHLAAVAGHLPPQPPAAGPARAAAVVYARRRTHIPFDLVWPAWAADRPAAGAVVPAGAPVCTVLATATGATNAAARAVARVQAIRARLAPPTPALAHNRDDRHDSDTRL